MLIWPIKMTFLSKNLKIVVDFPQTILLLRMRRWLSCEINQVVVEPFLLWFSPYLRCDLWFACHCAIVKNYRQELLATSGVSLPYLNFSSNDKKWKETIESRAKRWKSGNIEIGKGSTKYWFFKLQPTDKIKGKKSPVPFLEKNLKITGKKWVFCRLG